ncbi:exonuclease domain-containing protein [Maritimibacter sp. DP1N21-5]|uniref:exonuclease domain-containing protein n=1 Tax=Maritimibacter sp. DP1N21-5 TaxID=2836867 RepID=UPI00210506B9|nr:exonuclease domain-containing protein [Maritimibacter sp. DP1N21-5]
MTLYPTPEQVLEALLSAPHGRTKDAPEDSRGVYGLVDHFGDLRYIGSTSSAAENLRKRIHARHRTGSETTSHYFSRMYNTGRMWRDRNDPATKADGDVAKRLRNAFIAEYCRAVWVPLPDDADIPGIEQAVLAMAPSECVAWNRRGMFEYDEPRDLVDTIIRSLRFSTAEMDAINRQNDRFHGKLIAPVAPTVPAFPAGAFDFFALDVETANNDRASICQIGIACVRPDRSIETWVTYVDPETTDWSCSFVHGINAATVRGAPRFDDVLPILAKALDGRPVYQHSGFDRSAMTAACSASGITMPEW